MAALPHPDDHIDCCGACCGKFGDVDRIEAALLDLLCGLSWASGPESRNIDLLERAAKEACTLLLSLRPGDRELIARVTKLELALADAESVINEVSGHVGTKTKLGYIVAEYAARKELRKSGKSKKAGGGGGTLW